MKGNVLIGIGILWFLVLIALFLWVDHRAGFGFPNPALSWRNIIPLFAVSILIIWVDTHDSSRHLPDDSHRLVLQWTHLPR